MKFDSHSLGPLLHDAARLVRRRFEQQTADLGLSSAQWRLLIHVLKEGRISQARLADRLEIEPISVSRLLDRMEQAGWIKREADPGDRRVRQVVATRKAEAAGERIEALAASVYQEALSGIPEEAQKVLSSCLTSICSNMSELLAEAPGCDR